MINGTNNAEKKMLCGLIIGLDMLIRSHDVQFLLAKRKTAGRLLKSKNIYTSGKYRI